jgi:hypothetical protein
MICLAETLHDACVCVCVCTDHYECPQRVVAVMETMRAQGLGARCIALASREVGPLDMLVACWEGVMHYRNRGSPD